jgi:hypothetical protein
MEEGGEPGSWQHENKSQFAHEGACALEGACDSSPNSIVRRLDQVRYDNDKTLNGTE